MPDLILWKRLYEYDFNDINAKGAHSASGGGARHIALGVQNRNFQIEKFLKASGRLIRIHTVEVPGHHTGGTLKFATDPKRRGGEWRITDQFSDRHPAWSPAAGFPIVYHKQNRPYVFVVRVAGKFHARFALENSLTTLRPELQHMLSRPRGIAQADPELMKFLDVPEATLVEIFEEEASDSQEDEFNPTDVEDGRHRIFVSVLRRQGQPTFRRALLKAYGSRCAISDCSTEWVLEAAHITPYRGTNTNRNGNGLLLRADVHTLFDIGLISVDPDSRTVVVSSLLGDSDYVGLSGRPLADTKKNSDRPSKAALREHFSRFRL
jgi:hypothetical protein